MSIRATKLWLSRVWPRKEARAALLGEYQAMARLKLVLADIAARGGLSRPAHHPGDPCQTAWNDGRRSMAQEIIDLAGLNPHTLQLLIDYKPETRE